MKEDNAQFLCCAPLLKEKFTIFGVTFLLLRQYRNPFLWSECPVLNITCEGSASKGS